MTHTIIYSGEHPTKPDFWEVHVDRGGGIKWAHVFPKNLLDWRAAEYGIDPADVDTLVDIALHETMVPTQLDEQTNAQLKAKALPWLLDADNTDDARKYHLQRIRTAPNQLQVKGNKALDPIRQGHKPNHDFVSQAAQMVDIHRWNAKYGDLPTPQTTLKQVNAVPFVQTGIPSDPASPSTDSISSTTLKIGQ